MLAGLGIHTVSLPAPGGDGHKLTQSLPSFGAAGLIRLSVVVLVQLRGEGSHIIGLSVT